MIARYNSDLANTIGNLVNRTVAMVNKYFGGEILSPDCPADIDNDLTSLAEKTVSDIEKLMDEFRVSDSLEAILCLARRSNKYIDETTPWVLGKNEADKPRLATVLYNLLESIRYIAILISPFMPDTATSILEQINTDVREYESLRKFGGLKTGGRVNKATPLFARIEPEKMYAEIEKETSKDNKTEQAKQSATEQSATEQAKPSVTLAPEITIDDFAKVELRAAKVTACERVKKSDKLLCLKLDDGMGGRQVVSGIAQWYAPEDLIGKTVIVVANLKPVKLRGVESNGMICASDQPDGSAKVVFLSDDVPAGTKIR